MTCEYLSHIGPWMDGALDTAQAQTIAQHLQSCADCQAERDSLKALSAQIRAAHIAQRAPDHLRQRIQAALANDQNMGPAKITDFAQKSRPWIPAMIAAGLALWLIAGPFFPVNNLDHDLAGAHIEGLAASAGPIETPRDQLSPLLALGGAVAPMPKDFTDRGFKLLGARKARIAGRPGSALIYQTITSNMPGSSAQVHTISLFIASARSPADTKPVHHTAKGLSVIRWTDDGRDYAAVSDLERPELDRFVKIACDEL